MRENIPAILALDFDGVICDGLKEYFQTAWRTYCQILAPPTQIPPTDLEPKFDRLRPVIETGWEMPILISALIKGIGETQIWQDWAGIAQELLAETTLSAAEISKKLDRVRDEWITTDLTGWLSLHHFYPGVVEQLKFLSASSSVKLVIITTKEGRFIQKLLQQQGIQMSSQSILGKECQRSKSQLLKELISANAPPPPQIWFVEDRLETLKKVQQQPELNSVQLYLADWGYNTQQQRESIEHDPRIHLLSLRQFTQNFFPSFLSNA